MPDARFFEQCNSCVAWQRLAFGEAVSIRGVLRSESARCLHTLVQSKPNDDTATPYFSKQARMPTWNDRRLYSVYSGFARDCFSRMYLTFLQSILTQSCDGLEFHIVAHGCSEAGVAEAFETWWNVATGSAR